MVDRKPAAPGHEETIVPVEPGLSRDPAPAVGGRRRRRTAAGPRPVIGLGLGLAGAVVVFFLLPGWVADRQSGGPVAEPVRPEPAAEPSAPSLTPEELEALRDEAEALLARLLTQQGQLDGQSAAEWGGDDYERYQALSREGDDAYLMDAFYDAVPAYAQALELGETLLERSVNLVAAALEAGDRALEAGNSALAVEQFELVIGIEADNARGRTGLSRARQLPEVLALTREGEALESAGELEEAARAYRGALELDGLWEPARSALAEVEAAMENRRFESIMSRGLAALAGEEYEDAQEFFTEALVLRPGSPDALDGQTQAEQGRKLDEIALAEARALAFESRELWEMAIQLYRQALEADATLAFAQEGLERAQRRADLDLKLANLIGNPGLLFDDGVLRDSQALLSAARAVSEAGPRLEEQISELGRLVRLASTPIPVELRSDERTEVTVYRVGELGRFAVKQLELRPGSYTVVGSRDGYVDVRQTFDVIPGRALGPVSVQCVEPI